MLIDSGATNYGPRKVPLQVDKRIDRSTDVGIEPLLEPSPVLSVPGRKNQTNYVIMIIKLQDEMGLRGGQLDVVHS